MKKIWGVLFLGLFLCSNSFAAMVSVTTGGYIAAASEIDPENNIISNTIDATPEVGDPIRGHSLLSTPSIQNSKAIGFQERANITLTTELPVGSTALGGTLATSSKFYSKKIFK